MDLLERLLGHDQWATQRLLDRCRALSDEQLDTKFDIGLGSLRATFEHMIFNIEAWTAQMTATPLDRSQRSSEIASLAEQWAEVFASFAASAREIDRTGRMAETFTDNWGEQMTFAGAALHVILHNAEHRSEVVHMLQRLGCGDIEVDHGLWDHVSRGAVID